MIPTDKTLRLLGYVRVSTDDQARNGVSLEAQEDRIRAWATAYGHTLVGVESDPGVSGAVAPHKRPGLAKVLAAIRAGEVDGLVVYKLDRLSRSVRDILDLADTARKRGWTLASVTEALDTSTAMGSFVLGIFSLLAEMERAVISERTKAGLDQIAREGRPRSGRLPFGYRCAGQDMQDTRVHATSGQLAPYECEQRQLRAMLALRAKGQGARRIARTLNEREERNPRTGGVWNFGTVAAILRTHDRRARALKG